MKFLTSSWIITVIIVMAMLNRLTVVRLCNEATVHDVITVIYV